MNKNMLYEKFGFPSKVPEDDPHVYYVMELGKRYLIDPICWVKRPSTMPERIKELNVESLAILREACVLFRLYANIKSLEEYNFLTLEERIKPEAVIESLKDRLSSYSIQARFEHICAQCQCTPDQIGDYAKDKELQSIRGLMRDIEWHFAKNINQAIFKMVNDFRSYVCMALGVNITDSLVYDDHELDIVELKKEVQELKGLIGKKDSLLSILLALSEQRSATDKNGKQSIIPPLIIANETDPQYYQRNNAFNPAKVKGKWLNEAKIRIEHKGYKPPKNWGDLGEYIRKPNGKQYVQITNEMHKW